MLDTTLFAYLHTIPTEPLHEIGPTNPPLRVFQEPPEAKDVGYAPYAIVEEAPGTVVEAFHGRSNVMSRLITVALYQEPTAQGRTPSRLQLNRVFNKVTEAVHHVDEDVVTGNRFIELDLQVEKAPAFDPKTKGLWAAVRFRMLYFRP